MKLAAWCLAGCLLVSCSASGGRKAGWVSDSPRLPSGGPDLGGQGVDLSDDRRSRQ